MDHGEATSWFEPLYAAAADGTGVVPWDAGRAGPELEAWLDARATGEPPAGRAVVVGAGLGDDAALVAARGWATTAFDVAPTAVHLARERFPDSSADFVVGDLLDLPAAWVGAFDLVVEHYTVQALPVALRAVATRAVRSLVAPVGTLVVLATTTADERPERPGPPWPLTRAELAAFAADGLVVRDEGPAAEGSGRIVVLERS